MVRGRHDANDYVTIGSRDAAAESHLYARKGLAMPATFSLIYESADKRLCVYEDAAGHLNAVDASRLT